MAIIQCKECGKMISDSATNCPQCGAPVVKEIFCSNCGTKIPENSGFCPNCGTKLSSPAGKPAQANNSKRIPAAIFALILGTLGIHYFYIGKNTAGILTIVLSLCTCGIWGIVIFIQAILMLLMTDEDFAAKYVDTDKTFPLF